MRSLRFRLILSNLLPLLLVLPFVGLLMVYLLETQGIVASVSRDLTRQAVLVADTASLQPSIWLDQNSAQAFLTRISPRLSARVMLLDSGGRALVSSDPADENLIGKIIYSGQYKPDEACRCSKIPADQLMRAKLSSALFGQMGCCLDLSGWIIHCHPFMNVLCN